MEPIIVNSQLDLKRYFKINLGILLRRVRWVLPIALILLLVSFFTSEAEERNNTLYLWMIGWLLFYLCFICGLQYYKVKVNFKKNTSLGELKCYEISEDRIVINGQTTTMTTEWQHINKALEQNDCFLVFAFNNKGIIFLPKQGFIHHNWEIFKVLIKTKAIKNNFK